MWRIKEQRTRLKQLRPFIGKFSRGKMGRGLFFDGCLRASFAKSYELCVEAYSPRKNRIAFFLVPTLRSICEDLIILGYISRLEKADREELTGLLTQHEVETRLESQARFFKTARPDQPVLTWQGEDIKATQDAIRQIWKRNGWPGLNQAWMPPVRQIAEKHHLDLLTTLYDYLYRLTSGMVHFNPQVLLRSGWGGPPTYQYSPKNFDRYYLAFARIYGMLLFCLYFELFERYLRAGAKVRSAILEIREDLLLDPRWPEIVTFEEMNLKPPKGYEILRMAFRAKDADRRKHGLLHARAHASQPGAAADRPQAGGG